MVAFTDVKTCIMKVLITGAQGFLGSQILRGLKDHETISIGRNAQNDIQADLTKGLPKLPCTDMVVHVAGKAHVIPGNSREAAAFYDTNYGGTVKLAEALMSSNAMPDTFVFISTVAVYGLETGQDINESTPLSGETPYATSKIEAERFLLKWSEASGVNLVIFRLPLIVGPGAPGNLGAMVKNIRRGTYARIGSGEARRSMVLASDVAALLPSLRGKSGTYNLTDGIHPSFAMLEDHIGAQLGKKIRAIPPGMASWMARIGDMIPGSPFNSYRYSKLRQSLTFSHQRAIADLGWKPTPVLDGFIP